VERFYQDAPWQAARKACAAVAKAHSPAAAADQVAGLVERLLN
jgi:hypothetical protein